jgi:hypothetical protein
MNETRTDETRTDETRTEKVLYNKKSGETPLLNSQHSTELNQ